MLRECASEGEGVNERKVQAPSCMKDHDQMRTTGDLQRPITAAFSLAVLRCHPPSGKVAARIPADNNQRSGNLRHF